MKFDDPGVRHCNYSGCLKCFKYIERSRIQELNGRWYCDLNCITKQYQNLKYEGATHLVHQTFGPKHPVTEQVRRMQKEIKNLRKIINLRGLNKE